MTAGQTLIGDDARQQRRQRAMEPPADPGEGTLGARRRAKSPACDVAGALKADAMSTVMHVLPREPAWSDQLPSIDSRVSHRRVAIGAPRMPAELGTVVPMNGMALLVQGDKTDCGADASRHLADLLHRCGVGTLSFDLLTDDEWTDERDRFDVTLQVGRIALAIRWLVGSAQLPNGPYGLLACGSAAAAALGFAAQAPGYVAAVATVGGRPDLVWAELPFVQSPTLLIVGGGDPSVSKLSRAALRQLKCAKRLELIPGASTSLSSPGAFDASAVLAAHWMQAQLGRQAVW